MQKTYTSLYGQTAYVLLTGLQLVFVPNFLLATFGFDSTSELWIRVLGMLVLALTILYYNLARYGNDRLAWATVVERLFFCAGLVAFVLLDMAKPMLVGFALFEAGLAAWTWWELRRR